MGIWARIRTWVAAGAAAAIALLLVVVRWQANRLEERDRVIQDQAGWIDTTKRVQAAPKSEDAKEAAKWLKDYAE